MRIVFLDSWATEAHQGTGTTVGIANLASALVSLGHEVDLLGPADAATSHFSRFAFNLRVPRRLRASPLPDLVVGFDLDGFRWASSRASRPASSTPYVVCLKGIAADEARFARSMRERMELSLLAMLEKRNAGGADRVLVPSRYSARMATRCYHIPPDRIDVVPEAIDLERLRALRDMPPKRSERGTGGPTILSVARQYPRKDTATLLRALPRVLASHPQTRLRVIGGGPELPGLRALARELGCSSSVTFAGAVPDDATVQRAYLEADVFCLPSRQEGFGIVFVEAMSAGLPVVAARAGATPEVVRHGSTGLLVPAGDETALADALAHLLEQPEARRRMGAAGIRAAGAYDLEVVGRRFLDAVGSVIPPPGSMETPPAEPRS